MSLACDKCGTTDFAVKGRSFSLALACPDCRLVMCSECAGRSEVNAILVLCCYHCRSTGLCEATAWADRVTRRSSGPAARGR